MCGTNMIRSLVKGINYSANSHTKQRRPSLQSLQLVPLHMVMDGILYSIMLE